MSALSSIEWTDRTWNPVRGCSIVSPGCVNCYAMKFAHRFSGAGKPYEGLTKQTSAGPQWTGKIRLVDDALLEPLTWRKPQRVFVNSMSDLFHEGISKGYLATLFAVMRGASNLTFQVLTKRADRMLEILSDPQFQVVMDDQSERLCAENGWCHLRDDAPWPLPNVWLGVSCEDQQRADERIPLLTQTPAAVRFVSAEPLLGPIEFDSPVLEADSVDNIDWVIVGGESGPSARPCDVAWIRRIVKECAECSVPVFVKQLGSQPFTPTASIAAPLNRSLGADGNYWLTLNSSKGGDPSEWPEDLRVRQFPPANAEAVKP